MYQTFRTLVSELPRPAGWQTSLRWQHLAPPPSPQCRGFIRRKWLVTLPAARERVVYEEYRQDEYHLVCACNNSTGHYTVECAHTRAVRYFLQRESVAVRG